MLLKRLKSNFQIKGEDEMPCTEFETPDQLLFGLITMNMLDVLDDAGLTSEEMLMYLSKMNAGILSDSVNRNIISLEQANNAAAYITGKALISLNQMGKSSEEQVKFISQIYGHTFGWVGAVDKELSVSGTAIDPFLKPENRGFLDTWISHNGTQSNVKISDGPDRGLHWWIDTKTQSQGVTLVTRKVEGKLYRGTPVENPQQIYKKEEH